jgi:hypothetical protein
MDPVDAQTAELRVTTHGVISTDRRRAFRAIMTAAAPLSEGA